MILKWNKIPLIKADDFYKDLANYIEKWFDTSNCDEGRTKKQFVKKNQKTNDNNNNNNNNNNNKKNNKNNNNNNNNNWFGER